MNMRNPASDPATRKRDERLWKEAKAAARGMGRAGDYAYIMGIFKRMRDRTGGGRQENPWTAPSMPDIAAVMDEVYQKSQDSWFHGTPERPNETDVIEFIEYCYAAMRELPPVCQPFIHVEWEFSLLTPITLIWLDRDWDVARPGMPQEQAISHEEGLTIYVSAAPDDEGIEYEENKIKEGRPGRIPEPIYLTHHNVMTHCPDAVDELIASGKWEAPTTDDEVQDEHGDWITRRNEQVPMEPVVNTYREYEVTEYEGVWHYIGMPHPGCKNLRGITEDQAFGKWLRSDTRAALGLSDPPRNKFRRRRKRRKGWIVFHQTLPYYLQYHADNETIEWVNDLTQATIFLTQNYPNPLPEFGEWNYVNLDDPNDHGPGEI